MIADNHALIKAKYLLKVLLAMPAKMFLKLHLETLPILKYK